jgi:hypothetical protein
MLKPYAGSCYTCPSWFPGIILLKLSEKGLEWCWSPLIAGLQQRKRGFFDLFGLLLRLQFKADRDFSDSFSETVRKVGVG